MLPGPNLVYGCPNCGRKVLVKSMTSGNTSGATFYSDGTMDAPMLPKYPKEAKCKSCGTFFDFCKKNFVKKLENWMSNEPDCDWAEFLAVEDYIEKIKLKQGSEIANRLIIWQLANKSSETIETERYRENCGRLIELLKDTNEYDFKVTLAELYRNIGAFDKCSDIINALNSDFNWLKNAFYEQCATKNTKTFTLPRA